MKVAIPTDTNGGLSSIVYNHFGMAPTYTVIEIINNEIKDVEIIDNTSDHFGGSESPVDLLLKKNVGIVICSNLGPHAMIALRDLGFDIFFTKRDNVKEIVENFISGKLQRFYEDKASCDKKL
ncbi:MAG TPA: NifB/NifX family molybdenum-iron cluster-binding protein [Methanofastidiosum sp.]|jgi:predicted Fe-Mo cluster-binding NifX family protein|nr:NifB/NifX family molybdenum-iron cluster-binding protein [Methanofastidiosum sp.]HOG73731.1 NifB/NifX family molybdenum-iron cluster-binding protein [Methanofastidiosum sp.]HRZ18640.1 NifB/NifX family molybdenum-iron cluster-binding protein [Methanofastidiosum sp.]